MSRIRGQLSPEYHEALRKAGAFPMTEEEKRRKALEIQAQILGSVTRGKGQAGAGVIPAPGTVDAAADSVVAGAERVPEGKKIAGSSAATRTPEAAARGAQDPEIPERLKQKPNRKENEFMMNLMVLRNTLSANAPACRERARLAGRWVWRDIRLMLTLVNRIQEKLLRTMPASRDDYYTAYAKHGHYELHMDGPVRTARHILVTDKHLGSICEAAMRSECILCMREGSEIGRCGLREALLEAAPPSEVQDGIWRRCEYRKAAGQLIEGKEVTI